MRVKNSFRNFSYGFLGQIINSILSFASRTVFIYQLTVEYLGISGLFTNILSIFSLAELGIGSAIIIYMYKPLAEKDEHKLKQLSNFYAKAYQIIGGSVALMGIILLPFLKYLIKGPTNIDNIELIYLIFIANSSISYFFSYKRAIITADQKEYICTINSTLFTALQYILQIVVLILTKNYLFFLGVSILTTLGSNIAISNKANKLYPFLKEPNQPKLNRAEKKDIFKNVLAMMSHKLGSVVNSSSINILISSFIGVFWVGIYSNYILLINTINSFVLQLFNSMSASLGNLTETEEQNKVYSIFKTLQFLAFWIYGFCSICFLLLFNPFIKIWIGEKYLLDDWTVGAIVVNYFLLGISTISKNFVNVSKLFWNTKYKPWYAAIINIGVSIVLLKTVGIIGVFIGSIVSIIFTDFWVDPYVLFRYRFNSSLISYFIGYAKHTAIVIITGVLTYFTTNLNPNFIYKILICAIIPNVIFLLIYHKTKEFKYLHNSISILKDNFKNRA
jgi:O-antigen/teichoic acid export membrane protein